MSTTLAEVNATLRLAGLEPLSRDASAEDIASALADAAQLLDTAEA